VGSELSLGQFGCVVDSEYYCLFSAKGFSESAEFNETLQRFITGFHKIDGDVSRIAAYEEDEIAIIAITGWKRAANIAMNAL
jgi:hypothetical protein